MKNSKKDFIVEAEEILENVNNALLELQNAFNPDTLNSVFRAVHTLKGLSGLFGFKVITDLSHALESILDDLRLGKIDISDEVIGFIFTNMDVLKNLIAQVADDKEADDVSDTIRAIEAFRKEAGSKNKDISIEDIGISPSVLKVLSGYEEHRLKSNVKEGHGIYIVKAVYNLAEFAPRLEALNALLKSLGELIATLPVSEGVPDGSIGFKLLLGSVSDVDALKSKIDSADIEVICPPRKESQKAAQIVSRTQDVSLKSTTNTVRVDIEKLDRILDTVSELVLAKGAVVRIGKELAENVGYSSLTLDVHKISQTLDRKLAELQDHILELRMVPFSQIFTRLVQVVRRYTRSVGKEIDVELFGEDTKIDKQMAEEIIDPLIHLIRNSIDHGIEPNEKRIADGKKEHGTVTLKAFPEGNKVIVTVQDDGAGLDTERILSKALEKKLVPENQVLEQKEVFDLIFLPGLSTKKEVSEVSGRGVGIDVKSDRGLGTTFVLTLPITLAIIKALIVVAANEKFAVPLTSISETFFVEAAGIQTIEGREVFERRGEMLPLLRVADVFKLENAPKDEYFAVSVGFGTRRIGLLVDDLLEQSEVVIRPLGEYLKDVRGLGGAAEIGKHEIVLVLDIESLIDESVSSKRKINRAALGI
ncbi:MAG: chemotaxis protein CheA [Nitrospirae bacterium]|nr:chemotaxis protein CheA [Nitrospirota bacterium]